MNSTLRYGDHCRRFMLAAILSRTGINRLQGGKSSIGFDGRFLA